MNRLVAVSVIALLLVIPSLMLAKSGTTRITINSTALARPIEITDSTLLTNFRVWSGPGTSSNDRRSLIVDWSEGPVLGRIGQLEQYEISFYANAPNERLIYVVVYAYDPSTGRGFVYLPGRADAWYRLNVSTIVHGVEGNWFRSWDKWGKVAGPLITRANKR